MGFSATFTAAGKGRSGPIRTRARKRPLSPAPRLVPRNVDMHVPNQPHMHHHGGTEWPPRRCYPVGTTIHAHADLCFLVRHAIGRRGLFQSVSSNGSRADGPVTLPFVGATIERSKSFLLGEIPSSVASQVAFIEKVKALAPQYRTELLRQ